MYDLYCTIFVHSFPFLTSFDFYLRFCSSAVATAGAGLQAARLRGTERPGARCAVAPVPLPHRTTTGAVAWGAAAAAGVARAGGAHSGAAKGGGRLDADG